MEKIRYVNSSFSIRRPRLHHNRQQHQHDAIFSALMPWWSMDMNFVDPYVFKLKEINVSTPLLQISNHIYDVWQYDETLMMAQ